MVLMSSLETLHCARYGSPARQFDWGFPGGMAPQPSSGQQLPAGGQQTGQPVTNTAEAIAAQSQDYVDENLAAFQVDTNND